MEQTPLKPEEMWFDTPDTWTLCRAGGNGPDHPSQLYGINKYVKDGMLFLDYGAGSGTTWEAMKKQGYPIVIYRGADIIPKNTEWCKKQFPEVNWVTYKTDLIEEPDKSWDVVYSRHVVDHQKSFEFGLNEHCRVARKLVIIVLWRPLGDKPEHDIKHIIDQGKVYETEYTNDYSRPRVMEAIKAQEKNGWKLEELAEGIGQEVKGFDVVIVLSHE